MIEKYEQMELDTRPQLKRALDTLTIDAITTAGEMMRRCAEAPAPVRNRHEAYGIVAERLAKIKLQVKAIQKDTDDLLDTLADPNHNAIEAVSNICNSTTDTAATLLEAAAEMRRTLRDLYDAENSAKDNGPTPLEQLADAATFQEADPTDPDEMDEPGEEAGEMEE